MNRAATATAVAAQPTFLRRISTAAAMVSLRLLFLSTGALMLTAQVAAQAGGKALTAASTRDLNPFLLAPYPTSPFLTPGDVLLGRTYPSGPGELVRRDLITGAPFAPSGKQVLEWVYKTPTDYIRPFALQPKTARAPGQPRGPDFPPFTIDRIQPGTKLTVVSIDGAVSDRYTFGAPALRATLDGSLYESVAISIERNGAAYTTLHFGYRMGLVSAQTAENVPEVDRERYDLVSLPAPKVEGIVTEHIYRPLATAAAPKLHLFYAASETERAVLDESADWMRSGYEFKSGGYVPVCRFFYRPPNGGPSTHFYTAKADECEALKSMAGFDFEGTPFRASLPRPVGVGQSAADSALCPEGTTPIWRAFNRPVDAAVAPNHRYVTNPVVIQVGTPRSWVDEGIAFCVPQ